MKPEISDTQLPTKNLLGNKNFLLLWIASIFSSFAFPMYLLAEQWYVVKVLNLPNDLGWIMMATALPRVLFMVGGGVIADRFSCNKVMFITNISRAILIFGIMILLWWDQLTFTNLLIFAICFGILDAFFWPASESMIPNIVEENQITRANAFLQMTNQLSLIFGPTLAGFVIYQFAFYGVFTACIIALILSSFLVWWIHHPKFRETPISQGSWEEFREGLKYMKKSTFLGTLLSIIVVVNFFVAGPVVVGIPLIADLILKGNSVALSSLQSSFGFGTLVGAVIVGMLNIKKRRGIMLCVYLLLLGFLLLGLGIIQALWQGILLLSIIGIGTAFVNIPLISMIQEQVDTEKMGRVMSFVMVSSLGLLPLSFASCSTLLSLGVSISQLLVSTGVIVTLIATMILIWGKAIRTVDEIT